MADWRLFHMLPTQESLKPNNGTHLLASFFTDFLIGGTAGLASRTVLFPLCDPTNIIKANQHPPGLTGHLAQTNFLTLWRGATKGARARFFTLGTVLACKDYYRRLLNLDVERDGYQRWAAGNLAAGAATGATLCMILSAYDSLRVEKKRMVLGKADRFFIHGFHLRGFLHYGVYMGIYFGAYDSIKPMVWQGSFAACCGIAWGSLVAAQLPSRAIANVRGKLAAAGIGYEEIRWKAFWAMFFQVLRKEGATSLFKGIRLNTFAAMAVLPSYDLLQRWLVRRDG